MTILHLRGTDLYGSPERLIIGQCRHLPSINFVCASFVRGQTQNLFLGECEKHGLPTECIRESYAGDVRVVGQLSDVIKKHQVSLLVSHDYKSNFFGYFAARRGRVPQVAYFHGVTSEDTKVGLYNRIDRFMLPRMKKVIAVSSMTARFLQSRGLPEGRIEVVPNAVDAASLLDRPRPAIPAERPCRIIAVGRFSHEKGFDILLEAVAAILSEAPPFELHLYGMGPEEEQLKAMAARLGLGDIVKFCGFVDDLLPIFREVDFMVMSSRSEGMPVAILEAWSQRVGVLATTVGGVPEMIESGQSGLLVPPENIAALAERLLWAVRHRTEMQQFGEAGYEALTEKYTFTVQAERLKAIYSGLVEDEP